jgi:hypothetical protein
MLESAHIAAVSVALLSAGCGLDLGGLAAALPDGGAIPAPVDGAGPDASVQPDDASSPDSAGPRYVGPSNEAGPSASLPCSASSGPACMVVPTGWAFVAFAPDRSSPCPSGFVDSPSSAVEGLDAGISCGCGACKITTPPSCASGPVGVFFDMKGNGPGQCGTMANPSPLKNTPPGACGTDLFTGDYSKDDVEYVAPPPTGGTCTSEGLPRFTSEDSVCKPGPGSANCSGAVCSQMLPSPYQPCIAAPGDVACPVGQMSARHVVGTSSAVVCPPCPCTVTSQCSGTITLFKDATCTSGGRAIPTGQCVPISDTGMGMGMGGVSYQAYQYAGGPPASLACETTDAGRPGGGTLAAEETVCCSK